MAARDSDAIIVRPITQSRESHAIILGSTRPGSIHEKSWKTKSCKLLKKGCPDGSQCSFAHSIEEPRNEFRVQQAVVSQRSSCNNKQMSCKYFIKEEACPYGDKCKFSHDHQHQPRETDALILVSDTQGEVASHRSSHEQSRNRESDVKNLGLDTEICPYGETSRESQELRGFSVPSEPMHAAIPTKSHLGPSSVPSEPTQASISTKSHLGRRSSVLSEEPMQATVPIESFVRRQSSVSSEQMQATSPINSHARHDSWVPPQPMQAAVLPIESYVGGSSVSSEPMQASHVKRRSWVPATQPNEEATVPIGSYVVGGSSVLSKPPMQAAVPEETSTTRYVVKRRFRAGKYRICDGHEVMSKNYADWIDDFPEETSTTQ